MSISTLLSLSAGLLLFGLCLAALRFHGQVMVHALQNAFEVMARQSDACQPAFCPSVMLLKTCQPGETAADLASFCQQDYPQYGIRFVVQSHSEASVALVQQLIQQFPQRDIQQVNQTDLSQLLRANPAQIWLLAAGNLRVERDFLAQMIQPFRSPSIGIVGCARVLSGHPVGQFSQLRAIERQARMLIRDTEMPAGRSLAIRADLLAKLPQTAAPDSLANLIAAICHKDHWTAWGYRLALAGCLVESDRPSLGWRELSQQLSWARARRLTNPQRYWQQGLSYGTLYGLLLLGLTQGGMLGWAMLGCNWMTEAIALWLVGWGCFKDAFTWRLIGLLPLYSLASFSLWLCGFWGQVIAPAAASPTPQPVSYAPGRQLSVR